MRLTCPNCAAQYEVDAALIPDEGRDVQCSNCSKTWFELPPSAAQVPEEPAPVVSAPVADAMERTEADEGDPAEWEDAETMTVERAEPVEAGTPETVSAPAASAAVAEAAVVARSQPPKKRREVDPRALDILKEEADRELANRKKEREAVEVQSEFDLTAQDDGETPSRALRARMARLRGESDPRPQRAASGKGEGDGYVAPERELLPDIDEINSSLRPADADGEAAEAERRASFRRGFGAMVSVAAVLIVVYIAAPFIARSLPGLQPMMVAYVDAANGFRDFVDGIMR